jgi:hypothetical protein
MRGGQWFVEPIRTRLHSLDVPSECDAVRWLCHHNSPTTNRHTHIDSSITKCGEGPRGFCGARSSSGAHHDSAAAADESSQPQIGYSRRTTTNGGLSLAVVLPPPPSRLAGRFRRATNCATNKQCVWCLVDRNQVRFGGVSPKLAQGDPES